MTAIKLEEPVRGEALGPIYEFINAVSNMDNGSIDIVAAHVAVLPLRDRAQFIGRLTEILSSTVSRSFLE
jgi:hypothetical protein